MNDKIKNLYKEVQIILTIILIANLLVATLKIFLGYFISSGSIIADGIHSFSDGASNIVGLIGIKLAGKPADENHPYGHQKIEMLTSSLIGLLIAFLGVKIFWRGILSFQNPIMPKIETESLFLLVFTIFLNLGVTIWESKKGKDLKSPILISDAKHTKSDIYVSFGVLISMIALKLGLPVYIDALMSCIIAIFILHAAWEILQDNVGILLDGKVLEKEEIEKIVFDFREVKGVHKIRTRGSLAHVYADLHILVRGEMTVGEAHELSHKIEDKLIEKFEVEIQAHVHVEPYIMSKN